MTINSEDKMFLSLRIMIYGWHSSHSEVYLFYNIDID